MATNNPGRLHPDAEPADATRSRATLFLVRRPDRMRFLFSLALLLAVAPLAMAAPPPDSVDVRLGTHRWAHRLLFVVAPSESHDALDAQMEALAAHDAGVQDRDLRILTIVADGTSRFYASARADGRPITEAAVRRLRDRFDVPMDAVRVLLVGKDGTEKQREVGAVSVRALFDQIDAMPMRQREMQRDSSGHDSEA
jgi:hypothetical protein